MFFDRDDQGLRQYIRSVEALARPVSPEEELVLFERINNGEKEESDKARVLLLEANLDLAVAIAHHFTSRGMSLADLISDANIALLHSIGKYDVLQKPGHFRAYAASVIYNALKKRCWEHNRIISVPPAEMLRKYRLFKKAEDLSIELGREPSCEELGNACKMSARSVRSLRQIPLNTGSLDVIQWKAEFFDEDSDDGEKRPILPAAATPPGWEDSARTTSRITHQDSLIALRLALRKLKTFQYDVIRYSFNLYREKPHCSEEKIPLRPEEICDLLKCTKRLLVKTKYASVRELRNFMLEYFKKEFGVHRITPRLLEKVLAAERLAEQRERF